MSSNAANPISERDPSARSVAPWVLLACVSLGYFVLYLHRSVIGFVQPPLKAELQISDLWYGWLQPAFVIPYGIAQLFVGYLGDRFNRRRVLLWSLSASVLCVIGLGCAQNYEQLFALRVLLGLAQAPSIPAIASMMGDSFTARTRSTAVAIYLASYNVALVVAGRTGGQLADSQGWTIPWQGSQLVVSGWRTAFLSFAFIGVAIVIAIALGLREPKRAGAETTSDMNEDARPVGTWFDTLRVVLTVRSFLALAAVFVLFSVVHNVKDFWLARYYHERFGLTNQDAGTLATVWLQIGTLGGLLLGGVWADRWASRKQYGRVAVQAVGFACWVPTLIMIGSCDSTRLLKIAMLVFGIGVGLYQANLWTTTFEILAANVRSTAVGLLNVLATLASLATPLVGSIHDTFAGQDSHGESLGSVFTAMSLVAASILVLYALYITVWLPRDYRGPLRPSCD